MRGQPRRSSAYVRLAERHPRPFMIAFLFADGERPSRVAAQNWTKAHAAYPTGNNGIYQILIKADPTCIPR